MKKSKKNIIGQKVYRLPSLEIAPSEEKFARTSVDKLTKSDTRHFAGNMVPFG